MKRTATCFLAALGLVLLLLAPRPLEAATTGQERVVERARLALDAFLDDPNFEQMRVYVQNAYAVLIFPEMLEAGFFVGGQHGIGVLLVRDLETGGWGQPAFYSLFGGSFGLQFGGQSQDVVFTVMNEAAVAKLVDSRIRVKFGADAGLAAGRIGATVGAGTTTNFGEDIYLFAKTKGLFGGVAVDGAVVMPKDDWNRAYYGRDLPASAIVRTRQIARADINALHQSLTRF